MFKTNAYKDTEDTEETNDNKELQLVPIEKEGFFRKIINKIISF